MAVDQNIPYVWDQAITLDDGLILSSPLDYILTNGHTIQSMNTENLGKLCILNYGSTLTPMTYSCEVNRSTNFPYSSFATAFHGESHGNIGLMLAAGGTNIGINCEGSPLSGIMIGTEKRVNLKTGHVTVIDHGISNLPDCRVVIGGIDLSHFMLVPYLTGVDAHRTSQVSGYLKEYKEQYAASHPCITEIRYSIEYKGDLNSSDTGSSSGLVLLGSLMKFNNTHYEMDAQSQYNNVIEDVTGQQFATFGSVLFAPMRVSSSQISLPGVGGNVTSITGYPYGCGSTHGPGIQKMNYEIPEYESYPFCYVTLSTAQSIIKSTGLWVAESPDDIADAHGALTTSDGVYAPVVNAQGQPTGAVSGGGVSSVYNSPIYQQWQKLNEQFPIGGSDAAGAVTINPDTPVQPITGQTEIIQQPFTQGDSELLPGTPSLSGMGVFSNYYALGKTEVLSLNDFLWTIDDNVLEQLLHSLSLFGNKPIDAIINLRLYPFNVSALASSATSEEITLGRVGTGVYGLKLPSDCNSVLDIGSVNIPAKYNDFRDYAPYSSYSLYIPFIGTVNLNPNVYVGHTLTLRLVVDITTGKCTAVIYCEDVPTQYVDGMCAVEIPVTADDMSTITNAVIQGVASTAMSAATGDPLQIASTAVSAGLDVMFAGVGVDKTGNVGAAASFSMPIVPYVIISHPTAQVPDNYAHTYGLPANTSGQLSSYHGFTICQNVDLSGIAQATGAERQEIKNLLESGVYL